jgi:hypothetical protein
MVNKIKICQWCGGRTKRHYEVIKGFDHYKFCRSCAHGIKDNNNWY